MMTPSAWIYILTNNHNTTLYVGVTIDLSTRLWEHRTKQNPKAFTSKYNIDRLVYYEGFELITDANRKRALYKRENAKMERKPY